MTLQRRAEKINDPENRTAEFLHVTKALKKNGCRPKEIARVRVPKSNSEPPVHPAGYAPLLLPGLETD